MSYINKLKQRILDNSDTYNHFLNEQEAHKKDIKKLQNQVKSLQKELTTLDEEHTEVLDSYNKLFNVLYIDYDLKAKGILKATHDLCQGLLDFVDNVCKKHGLEYWLDYGNLLGAVRHEGFIPWDDDIDLGMMREDYEKFLEVIEDEIKEHGLEGYLSVHSYEYEGRYIVMFIQLKFVDKDNPSGLYSGLDIFAYDYIKDPKEDSWKIFKKLQPQFRRKLVNGMKLEDVLQEYFDELNITYEKQDHIISAIEGPRGPSGFYDFKILDSEDIFPLTKLKFYNKYYPCPNNYDKYLRDIYGDYTTIHKVVHVHGRLDYLKTVENVSENFDKFNEMFKDINENFE